MATLIPENSELKCCDGEVPNGSIHVHLKKYPTLRARKSFKIFFGSHFNQILFSLFVYIKFRETNCSIFLWVALTVSHHFLLLQVQWRYLENVTFIEILYHSLLLNKCHHRTDWLINWKALQVSIVLLSLSHSAIYSNFSMGKIRNFLTVVCWDGHLYL